MKEKCIGVKSFSAWKENVRKHWPEIKVVDIKYNSVSNPVFVGQDFPISIEVILGELTPEDIEVQAYYGPVEKQEDPNYFSYVVLNAEMSANKKGNINYSGNIKCIKSGQQCFTVRILPKHPQLIHPFELGLIYWAS